MKKIFICLALMITLISTFPCSAQDRAGSPTVVIKSMETEIMKILKNCNNQEFSMRLHKEALFDIASRYVAIDEVAPRVVGPKWKDQDKIKQDEFKKLFREIVFENYIDRLDNYKCKQERIIYEGETISGNTAVVSTKVKVYNGELIAIDYRMKKRPEGWQIYDLVVEGISIVQNYRSQFTEILQKQSFDGLIEMLRQKVRSASKG